MDFNAIFGNIQDQISQATADVQNVGVPALEASLEKWGADKLTEMGKKSQAKTDVAVKQIIARPQDQGGIGSYLSSTIKNPIVQQYGTPIAIGVTAIIVFFLIRKG